MQVKCKNCKKVLFSKYQLKYHACVPTNKTKSESNPSLMPTFDYGVNYDDSSSSSSSDNSSSSDFSGGGGDFGGGGSSGDF